jgi:hypothetical protein
MTRDTCLGLAGSPTSRRMRCSRDSVPSRLPDRAFPSSGSITRSTITTVSLIFPPSTASLDEHLPSPAAFNPLSLPVETQHQNLTVSPSCCHPSPHSTTTDELVAPACSLLRHPTTTVHLRSLTRPSCARPQDLTAVTNRAFPQIQVRNIITSRHITFHHIITFSR